MIFILSLILLGAAVGAFGTLIGAGGGFILVPVLLLLYPNAEPESITAISLGVVFFNSFSGSIAYSKMKRIDYKSGWLFAAATLPGAIIGAATTDLIPRHIFNGIFGVLMVVAASYLLIRRRIVIKSNLDNSNSRWIAHQHLTEADGTTHDFSYDLRPGLFISLVIGYISTLLGIGGGIIHVPALSRILNFPVHIATATSHFILAIMALAGTLVHYFSGSFAQDGIERTLWIGIGAVIGAQLGAKLSSKVRSEWILNSLAIALGIAGLRIGISAL